MKHRAGCLIALILLLALPTAAQVGGSGTPNFVPRWTGSTTLGNSNIVVSGGLVGIGVTNPVARLTVSGPNGTANVSGGNAPLAFQVNGGSGASNDGGFGPQGAGGHIEIAAGNGASLPAALALGGTGAMVLVSGGSGADCIPASVRCSAYNGGNGGSVTLQPGAGGSGRTEAGHAGYVLLAPTGGKVGIGEMTPSHTLEVKVGGTTLADAWVARSSRRFKSNIQPLTGALEKIEQLQGVSYDRNDDGQHEVGLIGEEVDVVVPEVVSRDPETKEVQGVDYSRLVALLIEAVKSQEVQIQQLKEQINQLTLNSWRQ